MNLKLIEFNQEKTLVTFTRMMIIDKLLDKFVENEALN